MDASRQSRRREIRRPVASTGVTYPSSGGHACRCAASSSPHPCPGRPVRFRLVRVFVHLFQLSAILRELPGVFLDILTPSVSAVFFVSTRRREHGLTR